MSIVDDNPCPNCRRLPTLMAGINVPGGKKEHLYIVCWTDNLAKRVAEGAQWTALHKPPDRIPWRQCSEYHLQTEINGEIIDYWPTKRKFQYRGKVEVGDVEAFIKRLQQQSRAV